MTSQRAAGTACGQEHATYECMCPCPHYPLRYFSKDNVIHIATRGTKPVENLLADGWQERERSALSKRLIREFRESYDRSHRFDWLHTPTYLDDRETHERMKAQTARRTV